MTTADRSRMQGAVGWALEILLWTLATWGVWLVTLTAVSAEDLAVGGGCALACGVVAAFARRLVQGRARPTLADLRPVWLLPLAIVMDTVTVLAAPWRPTARHAAAAGTRRPLDRVDLGAQGPAPAARARRSFATLVVSASPGTVVVEADPERGELLYHSFASGGPSLPSRYTRR